MGLEYYGVDKDAVLSYLPHQRTAGQTLPDYDLIEPGGDLLDRAAADVQAAIIKGGFASAAGSVSAATPIAYAVLRGAVAERAAIMYSSRIALMEPDALDNWWMRSSKILRGFEGGASIGELVVTDNRSQGQFDHGSMSSTTLNSYRFRLSDEL